MKQILIYADSLSWGLIPDTRQRFPFDKRWPGVFENTLNGLGQEVRIVENCINSRRTVWDDPFKDGRNGLQGLAQVIEMHSPLALVILMLGVNDFQSVHNNEAWASAQGSARLIEIIRNAPIEPEMPIPEIMLVAPPPIIQAKSTLIDKFAGAEKRCIGLADELEKVATDLATLFFNAGNIVQLSPADGIHLDEPEHQSLGKALAKAVLDKQVF